MSFVMSRRGCRTDLDFDTADLLRVAHSRPSNHGREHGNWKVFAGEAHLDELQRNCLGMGGTRRSAQRAVHANSRARTRTQISREARCIISDIAGCSEEDRDHHADTCRKQTTDPERTPVPLSQTMTGAAISADTWKT